MTIQFTCQCGKQLRTPDEFAGRQTKCPACQRGLVVPAAETAIMPAAGPGGFPTPTPAASPPAPANQAAPAGLTAAPAMSKLALFSLIFGCVGFCLPVLASVPAILLGFLGLKAIKKSGGQVGGQGLAITGLVLGFVTIPLIAIYLLAGGGFFYGVSSARDAANRIASVNNLKQIVLATQDYADRNQVLPSEAGRLSRLSWRVQILPFLGEDALYKRFRQDEPWDSPTNQALLAEMPKVYLDPRFQAISDQRKGLTYYRGFVCQDGVLGSPTPLTLGAITNANGTTTTILALEAGDPVPWTKPEDPGFNGDSPFGGPERTKFLVAYVSGEVRLAPAKTDRKAVRACLRWNNKDAVIPPGD